MTDVNLDWWDEEDEYDDEDCDDDYDEEIGDLYPFELIERDLIGQLSESIRRRIQRTDSPRKLQKIATFLFHLDQLPYFTLELDLRLEIVDSAGGSDSYVRVEFNDYWFILSMGNSMCMPTCDSSSSVDSSFTLRLGGFRCGSSEYFSSWLQAFDSAQGNIEFEGHGDFYDSDEKVPNDGWDRLEKYWEKKVQDTGDC